MNKEQVKDTIEKGADKAKQTIDRMSDKIEHATERGREKFEHAKYMVADTAPPLKTVAL